MARRRPGLARFMSIVFAWLAITTFSGVLIETLLVYPNIFRDVPASLALSMEFFSEVGPGDVFPVLGMATLVAGVLAVWLVWPWRGARARALGAVAVNLAGEFAFSAWYFWPRNTVMFVEGARVHPAEVLERVAWEFETGHWLRLAMCAVTAALAFSALLQVVEHNRGATSAGAREAV